MATIDDLIAQIEVELETAEKRAKKCGIEMTAILSAATNEGRANLSEDEHLRVAELTAARDQYRKDIAGVQKKLADARKVKEEDIAIEAESREVSPTGAARVQREQRVKVGQEERTYHKGNDPRGGQFMRDVVASQILRDPVAQSRLAQHMAEERVERGQYLQRASDTSNFAGLVVPQYLTELYAPVARALRPFANICNRHQLPENGLTVNISRITTGAAAAIQSAENAAVQSANPDDTILSPAVQTAAGQVVLSRQAIERGTNVEDIIVQDLFNAVATNLDSTLINQATNGLTNIASSTAGSYVDASPTGAEAYSKVIAAASASEAVMLALGKPTHAVMHSRRWYWLSAQMASTWPLINSQGIPPQNAGIANPSSSYGDSIRGTLPLGLSVVVDNNIGTTLGAGTEDEIYVVPATECHLWEDLNSEPTFIRADQTNAASLGVLLVAYQYFAYTFARYTGGTQKVSGTGLIAPTF